MAKKKDKAQRYERGQRPWRDVSVFAGGPGQKWTLWASVGVIVLAVVLAGFVLLPKPGPSTSDTAGSALAPTAGAESEQLCGDTPVGSDATPPKDLEWTSVHGTSWPVSASVGPKKHVDGLGYCFDRSPIGAALAAVGELQSSRTADPATLDRIFSTQFIQNKGLDVARAETAKLFETQPVESRPWGRSIGYKIISFTPDVAHVLLVEQWTGAGQYLGWTTTVVWTGGDWRLQFLDDGQLSANGSITVDPTGFTRWEAGS